MTSAVPSERSETITHEGRVMCILIRAEPRPGATTFYTPDAFNLQVGHVVYPAGGTIARHTHRPVIRSVAGTSEVVVVQEGRVYLDVYTDQHALICTREMAAGDAVALVSGGHGFRVIEDTVLIEVKQGPYSGVQEKDRF